MASAGETSPEDRPPAVRAFVDAHAHLHPRFAPGAFLAGAAGHVARAARAAAGENCMGMLLLADMAGDDGYARLRDAPPDGWRVAPAPDGLSLIAESAEAGAPLLVIVAGRQMATSEGLEVLALGCREALPDGLPLEASIARAVEAGALPALPWGVGKWTGSRGALIGALVGEVGRFPDLCFGDSGARAAIWPRSPILASAERAGRVVLSGTDPLPLASEAGKAGRYGTSLRLRLDRAAPFAALRRALGAPDADRRPYGSLERPDRFLVAQAAMQIRKRLRVAARGRAAS